MKFTSLLKASFLSILLFSAIFSSDNLKAADDSKPTIKIGVILPLTGDLAFIGEAVWNGITLALESLGDTKYHYEIIYEDNHYDPKQTALITPKLINVDKVDVIISTWTETGLIVTPIAAKNKIVHFGLCWAPAVADGVYNFDLYAPPKEQARILVEAFKSRGIDKVAFLFANLNASHQLLNELYTQLPAAHIEIVGKEFFNSGERDFRTNLAKLRETKPQAYCMYCFSPELELIGRQYKEMQIKEPLTTIEAFDETQQQSLFEGDWYAAPNLTDATFADNYMKRFHSQMFNPAFYDYDIIHLLVSVYETFPTKPTPTQFAEALRNLKTFHGIAGNFKQNDHGYFEGESTIKQIQNGKAVVIGK